MKDTAKQASIAVTLTYVAKHCGRSGYPVSRVLNGKPGVNAKTSRRILAVAAELGYDPAINEAARRLVMRKSGQLPLNYLVGIIMPMPVMKMNFFRLIFEGISEVLTMEGFGLMISPRYNIITHEVVENPLPPVYKRGEVDGIIFHGEMSEKTLGNLRGQSDFRRRPIVIFNRSVPGCFTVMRDERQGAYQAAAHLLTLGHRQICYFRKSNTGFPADIREKAFRKAFQDFDADPDAGLLPVIISHVEDIVEEPLRQALSEHPHATALMALKDPNAVAAVHALQRIGLKVPQDFSVIGYDDTDSLLDAYGKNLLTTVHFPIAEMGRKAAQVLLGAIRDPSLEPSETVFPAALTMRSSTAVPGSRAAVSKIKRRKT
ncbi:MAG: LacI family DNA-binding transcriptional regulator [Victivallales bacterium]|jgi:DNA-binding LacI/PurR family transcriptional regulator